MNIQTCMKFKKKVDLKEKREKLKKQFSKTDCIFFSIPFFSY